MSEPQRYADPPPVTDDDARGGPDRHPVLQITDLSAGYDSAPIVRRLHLSVAAGEVVALLGANGAGKTTTLRAISGLVKLTNGTISLAGADLVSVSPTERARLGIAHVPEGRGIFFGLTVAEHFRLGVRVERADIEGVLEHFPALRSLQDRRAGLLSGGEQQMLAIACALTRKPKLLLLDELSLGLAPVIVERLLPVIRRFADERQTAVILVEQHVRLGLEIADRAYVLAHGEIVTSGTAEHLRSDADLLVASYLGQQPPSTAR
jgi:ABC-type branched-subunit amino acid transport system ATPase component